MSWITTHSTVALKRLSEGLLALIRTSGRTRRFCVVGTLASGAWDASRSQDLLTGPPVVEYAGTGASGR